VSGKGGCRAREGVGQGRGGVSSARPPDPEVLDSCAWLCAEEELELFVKSRERRSGES